MNEKTRTNLRLALADIMSMTEEELFADYDGSENSSIFSEMEELSSFFSNEDDETSLMPAQEINYTCFSRIKLKIGDLNPNFLSNVLIYYNNFPRHYYNATNSREEKAHKTTTIPISEVDKIFYHNEYPCAA